MSSLTASQQLSGAKRGRALKWVAIGIVAVVVLALVVVGVMALRMSYVPSDLDYSTTRVSQQSIFKATIRPAVATIPINTIHSWTLHVETPDGKPVENAAITLNGDMPQHGHGLPTKPVVSKYLGNGDYLVEGLKFQMTGWWVVDFDVTANGKTDRVSFNLMLK
jgi:hypothetical protein